MRRIRRSFRGAAEYHPFHLAFPALGVELVRVVDVLEAPGVRVGDADELIERVVQRRRGVPLLSILGALRTPRHRV